MNKGTSHPRRNTLQVLFEPDLASWHRTEEGRHSREREARHGLDGDLVPARQLGDELRRCDEPAQTTAWRAALRAAGQFVNDSDQESFT